MLQAVGLCHGVPTRTARTVRAQPESLLFQGSGHLHNRRWLESIAEGNKPKNSHNLELLAASIPLKKWEYCALLRNLQVGWEAGFLAISRQDPENKGKPSLRNADC